MKSTIKNLLFSAAAVLLACSFTEVTRPAPEISVVGTTPVGGAYLVFAGKFGGEVTKSEIEKQTTLGVDGCAKGSRIFQFTLEVSKAGKTTAYRGSSNVLSKEIITGLRSLSTGDSFEFKKVKAYLPNGKDMVDVHGKKFTIVAKKA